MAAADRPAWVQTEYERIALERTQASRAADRASRLALVRVCLEMIGWTIAGCVIAAFAFRVTDYDIGMAFLYGGMTVNVSGVLWSVSTAYRRGAERGDW